MRTLLSMLLVLFFCVSVSTGCMVLDEVDNAKAKMVPHDKKEAAKTEAAGTAAASGSASGPLLEESKRWWHQATSLAPNDVESSIVKCRLGKVTEFRSRDDCLSRGGVPQGVSG